MTNSFFAEFEFTLARRGFTYGGGRISPDNQYFYINIPKNASTYLDQRLSHNGWNIGNSSNGSVAHLTPVVVLRDPVDRWISGITQYLNSFVLNAYNGRALSAKDFINQYCEIFERFLFDQVIVDDHTMPQYYFVDDIDLNRAKYFYFGPTLSDDFVLHFNLDPVVVDQNRRSDNINKRTIATYIQQRLEDSRLLSVIKTRYARDYELINQANLP